MANPPVESVTVALILVESVKLISTAVAARTGLPASVTRPVTFEEDCAHTQTGPNIPKHNENSLCIAVKFGLRQSKRSLPLRDKEFLGLIIKSPKQHQ